MKALIKNYDLCTSAQLKTAESIYAECMQPSGALCFICENLNGHPYLRALYQSEVLYLQLEAHVDNYVNVFAKIKIYTDGSWSGKYSTSHYFESYSI
jgi:hypothetical protein